MSTSGELPALEWADTDEALDIYASLFNVTATPWDISIGLGRPPTVGQSPPAINHVATLTLSPGAAKALAKVLTNTVAAYEAQIGPISVPEEYR